MAEEEMGVVPCGDCLSLLCWTNKTSLHLADEEELKRILSDCGEEEFKRMMEKAKDLSAFHKGLV